MVFSPSETCTRGQQLLAYLRMATAQKRDGVDLRWWLKAESFRETVGKPMTIRRAAALAHVLDAMPLVIHSDERLVGSMAALISAPMPDGVTGEQFGAAVAEVQALGERNFWTNSDHCAPDYDALVREGIGGIRARAVAGMVRDRPQDERDFLESIVIALDGVSNLLLRYSHACRTESKHVTDADRQAELIRLAEMLQRVATDAPRSFHEAVQLVWTFHFIYSLEGRGAMAFGRMDQFLYATYAGDLEAGSLTRDEAGEILESLWAKLEEPGMPNPIQNITIGGQTRDGTDATNDLSYLILEVTGRMKTPASNLSARTHKQSEQRFVEACAEVIKTGIGFPAVFNDEALVAGLQKVGIPLEDARDIVFVGCIETFLPGCMPPWSDSRLNLLKALELALHNGIDPATGEQMGVQTGDIESLATFEDLLAAFQTQIEHLVADHVKIVNDYKATVTEPESFTSPLLSALTRDCVGRGKDINNGGTLFKDFHGPAGVGIATTTDALAALRTCVYEERRFELSDLVAALDRDFDGDEVLRQTLVSGAPKYGNGDEATDKLAARIAKHFCQTVLSYRTISGGRFVPLLAANTSNIPAGREVGATPDGRHAFTPLSDAASPHFGRDVKGPTQVIRSLARVDYSDVVGGSVVNMRFERSALAGERGTKNLAALIRAYFDMGGGQMQFNVTNRKTLETAREKPEEHRNLLVRVSGFSAVYVGLPDEVQRDILARTEQTFG